MKKQIFAIAALFLGATIMFSCQQVEEPVMDQGNETRALGDKTPMLTTYVEINDTNPLNVGDYTLPNGKPLYDIVEFFAANIHKRTVNGVVEPTLYFNDKMTNIFENGGYLNYVKPLQDKGIKVLVTILGDWQDMGLANMNSTQTTQFAQILAHVVEKYGLDGIGFDDEYAGYTSTNNTSYNEIIIKLRALLPAGKLITVFDWGYTGSINAEASACIDYGYHGSFSASYFATNPGLGLAKSKWSPISLNLGLNNSTSSVRSNSSKALAQGYGAIMNFNIRRSSDRDPMSVLQAIAAGAGYGTITRNGGDRPQDWTFVPGGYEINMDQVK